MSHFGEHLTYDGYGGGYAALDCRATVVQALTDLVATLDMTILGGPEVYLASANNGKDPGGWTGVVVLQESHISIHTFPARGFLSADVYTCQNGLDTTAIKHFFRNRFGIADEEVNFLKRGTRYPMQNIHMLPTRSADIFVAECELGRGLFATRDFALGETILNFTGPLISLADAIAKGDSEGNPLQIGSNQYIDLEPPGVFINHSCAPNAGIRHNTELIALQTISSGEEIRYDYSNTIWEDGPSAYTMPCRCGTAACRGIVANFRSMPIEQQRHYLALGVVQRFIVERLKHEGLIP